MGLAAPLIKNQRINICLMGTVLSQIGMDELLLIKETLCRHFGLPVARSKLSVAQRNVLSLQGGNNHYECLIQDGAARHRVFGKISPNSDREYRNIRYLVNNVPAAEMQLSRPIAVIGLTAGQLLLLEYLEGYSHFLSSRRLRYLSLGRSDAIVHSGKLILDTIYSIQQRFPMTCRPLSASDAAGIPNQPSPMSVFHQLDTMRSLTNEGKKKIRSRIDRILDHNIPVRRGMIHGDLGLRNVLALDGRISFIDWDFMQKQGFSLLDPCYFVVILEMRSLQLLMSRKSMAKIDRLLFDHIRHLEGSLSDERGISIEEGIWFGKCLSMIDTLWWYERDASSPGKALLKQRHRQVDFLSNVIERETVNEHD